MKIIKNLHKTNEVYVIHGGKKYTIAPLSGKAFANDVADEFLRERPGVCVADTDAGRTSLDNSALGAAKTVWLANVSGAHYIPKTIRKQQLVDKNGVRSFEERELPNPNAEKHIKGWTVSRGYHPVKDQDGKDNSKPIPPIEVKLYPGTRRAFAEDVANSILGRDGLSACPGGVIRTRAPGACEPDETWEYEKLHAWLEIVDAAHAGPSKAEVEEASKSVKKLAIAPYGKDPKRNLEHHFNAMLEAAWYCVLAPNIYMLPSETKLEEYMTQKTMPVSEEIGSAEAQPTA